jgi:hypothetical protein
VALRGVTLGDCSSPAKLASVASHSGRLATVLSLGNKVCMAEA